jgi:hypothetical protein
VPFLTYSNNQGGTVVSDTKFTSETAAEAGRKSGETRRRRKKPDEAARAALSSGASAAANALVSIVKGDEGFEQVKPELKFKAALVVLEYVLGKPAGLLQNEDKSGEDSDSGVPTFDSLLKNNELLGGIDD